jgi:hypothetical protein
MQQFVATREDCNFKKAEIPDEVTGVHEWMWMCVRRCDDENRLVFGTLDNVPINEGSKLKVGSEAAVSYDHIREHRKSSAFDFKN